MPALPAQSILEAPEDIHLGFVLHLARQALAKGDLPESALPLLEGVLDQTSALGVVYLERRGDTLLERAAVGEAPEETNWEEILAGGGDARNFLVQATEQADSTLLFDDPAGARSEEARSTDPEVTRNAMAVEPVLDGDGAVLGALVGCGSPNHVWSEWEEGVFTAVSAILSSLTVRQRAETDARAARESALRALGQAIEYRDYETKGHTDRVTALAVQIGGHLGLDATQIQELRWGAYLHDVGKLAIPDHILMKPAGLNEEEWETMKSHVEAGESFAAELGFVPDGSIAVVRHHHERWDGNGYPDGLEGDEIPLLARVFCACDALDAMTSDRPYHEAKTMEEGLAEIAAEAGSQFDPDVAGVFARLELNSRL